MKSVRFACCLAFALLGLTFSGRSACQNCDRYLPGVPWGICSAADLTQASGIAASRINPGVIWAHNDAGQKVFALSTNGYLLASFDLDSVTTDTEGIAVGPGPSPGVSYIYLGDIGGGSNGLRSSVEILRVPEPTIDLGWELAPKTENFAGMERVTLDYPDGRFDAEVLMVDPLTTNLFIVTKSSIDTRLYGCHMGTATNGETITLRYLRSTGFGKVSAGDISPDGKKILLRREDFAIVWARCDKEPVSLALSRTGLQVPVAARAAEPNGEAIAFLQEGSGYLTISEGTNQPIYFFQSLCPTPPSFTLTLSDQLVYLGASNVTLKAAAVGNPPPTYLWLRNNQVLAHVSSPSLTLPQVSWANSGRYDLIASNAYGSITSSAAIKVESLVITEVQSSTAPSPNVPTADWWELTNFGSTPVDLSGWRFNDSVGGLVDAFIVENGVIISPGETIVLAERLSPTKFRNWWGATNLPSNLRIIEYSGSGLGFGAGGDGIRLWDNSASGPAHLVATVDFGQALPGVSFNFDPVTGLLGQPSQLEVNGVFKASLTADVGSPGWIGSHPAAPGLSAVPSGSRIRISFQAEAGRQYILETARELGRVWEPSGDVFVADATGPALFDRERTSAAQFYRIVVR